MRYLYCPRCGRKLTPRPAGDDGLVPYCDDCGQYWFDSFASCVIVLVANEFREIAMLRQSYLSDEYWSYVAGFITPGETAEQTAFREVREELGLELEQIALAIRKLEPIEHRLQLVPGDMIVIDDTLNEDSDGAFEAVRVLAQMPGRRIAVTPGLGELGA